METFYNGSAAGICGNMVVTPVSTFLETGRPILRCKMFTAHKLMCRNWLQINERERLCKSVGHVGAEALGDVRHRGFPSQHRDCHTLYNASWRVNSCVILLGQIFPRHRWSENTLLHYARDKMSAETLSDHRWQIGESDGREKQGPLSSSIEVTLRKGSLPL